MIVLLKLTAGVAPVNTDFCSNSLFALIAQQGNQISTVLLVRQSGCSVYKKHHLLQQMADL